MLNLYNIGLLLVAFILHELGHYLAFRWYGYKPTIRLRWFGADVGSNIYHRLKPKQAFLVHYTGIWIGMIPVFFFGNQLLVLVYFIMSSADITQMIGLWSVIKDKRKLVYVWEEQVQKLKQSEVYEHE